MNFNEFNKKFPTKIEKDFKYRYYENVNSDITVVLLVGGIGMSDLIYNHFDKFSKEYSVITFDYDINCNNNEQLIEAIYNLLTKLNKKVWFIGQSLGGFIAQLFASKYPDITAGLVLSNTGSLSENLNNQAKDSLIKMINSSKKSKKIVKCIPFGVVKKLISKKVMKKYSKDFNNEELVILKNLCEIMEEKLEKSYELHMIDLLIDMQNHLEIEKDKFKYLSNKVLLILSDDDETFTKEVKEDLINAMYNPTVKRDLKGGHLALMVNADEYIEIIVSYINSR